jgi:L-aspartate oxidase
VHVATDFLIIGSGIAGLRAAADLATAGDVVILTKADEPSETNTGYAQGGIAAAIGEDDSPARHADDTLAAGDGLSDPAAVQVLVEEGPRYVRELMTWGAAFDRDAGGAPALGREAAHSARRVLHAHDATGREIGRVLWTHTTDLRRVSVLTGARAIEILTTDGHARGARFVRGGAVGTVHAEATLVATGGSGQVYLETSNPAIATGDGTTLAWHAGARVADLEFVQFHPTVMAVPEHPRFLLSEALRGEGAHLVNRAGERFMARYEPAGELAARDLVARAIAHEAARTGGPVFLTLAHLDAAWVHERFPTISAACRRAGLDLARDRIPVSPAAHYFMGGIETDLWGRTTVLGLYAAGEAACTGVHGANRLASNSLLEGLVFGARAAQAMREPPRPGGLAAPREVPGLPIVGRQPGHEALPDEAALRTLMWTDVGLVRAREPLEAAAARLDGWRTAARQAWRQAPADPDRWRLTSLATVGTLVARAALRREESRGAHYRADVPRRDDVHWQVHVVERGHVEQEAAGG